MYEVCAASIHVPVGPERRDMVSYEVRDEVKGALEQRDLVTTERAVTPVPQSNYTRYLS
jgi:hypothetical protein